VLRKHQPGHVLLKAARADADAGMIDVARLADMLKAARGRIAHRNLPRVSPLAVPILLEVGRESVQGSAPDEWLADAAAAQALIDESCLEDDNPQTTLF